MVLKLSLADVPRYMTFDAVKPWNHGPFILIALSDLVSFTLPASNAFTCIRWHTAQCQVSGCQWIGQLVPDTILSRLV